MSTPLIKTGTTRPRSAAIWAMAILYTALLTVASLLPSAGQNSGGWDSALSPAVQNVLHIPAYVLLTILLLSAADRSWPLRWPGALALVLVCILYGVALECIQAAAIPGRTGSLGDAFRNAVGGAGGYAAWVIFRNIRRQIRT